MPRTCNAALDEARRLVARPDARTPVVVLMNAWATLKAARGQSVDFGVLGDAHHITDRTLLDRAAPEPAPLVAEIDAARDRVKPRIRAAARALGLGPTGGDAA